MRFKHEIFILFVIHGLTAIQPNVNISFCSILYTVLFRYVLPWKVGASLRILSWRQMLGLTRSLITRDEDVNTQDAFRVSWMRSSRFPR